MTVKVFKRLQ